MSPSTINGLANSDLPKGLANSDLPKGLANSDLPKRSETFIGLANSDLPKRSETFKKICLTAFAESEFGNP